MKLFVIFSLLGIRGLKIFGLDNDKSDIKMNIVKYFQI